METMWTVQLDDVADTTGYAVRVGAVVVAAVSADHGAGPQSAYLLGLDWARASDGGNLRSPGGLLARS